MVVWWQLYAHVVVLKTRIESYSIKDALFDKVKGAWAGQVIGCTYGGPTEFRYLSTMIPDSIVMPWGPGEIKNGTMVVAAFMTMYMST